MKKRRSRTPSNPKSGRSQPDSTPRKPTASLGSRRALSHQRPTNLAKPPLIPAGFSSHRSTIRVLFEDSKLIVVDKPAGLATAHVPADQESLYTWARQHCRTNEASPPPFVGIVSRLDVPVSGVVVMAKTQRTAALLSQAFRDRHVEKEYVAIVEGRFPAPLEEWVEWNDLVVQNSVRPMQEYSTKRPPDVRSIASRSMKREPRITASIDPRSPQQSDDESDDVSKECLLRARVMRRMGEVSLVELRPSTGRRHQLRIQLSRRACPIVGDRMYGARLPFELGIALHSRSLTLDLPHLGGPRTFRADCPDSWRLRYQSLLLERNRK